MMIELKNISNLEHVYFITKTKGKEALRANVIHDVAEEAFAAYGIKRKGVSIIRPDLYIETIQEY